MDICKECRKVPDVCITNERKGKTTGRNIWFSQVVENLDKSHEIRDFRLYFLDKDMENCIIRLEHNDAKRQENKTELVAAIAERAELSKKDSEKALKAFVDVVAEELKKGEKIQLVGFGTFEVSERSAREGRNPQTGETMKISACKAPKFKAGKALKDAVNA